MHERNGRSGRHWPGIPVDYLLSWPRRSQSYRTYWPTYWIGKRISGFHWRDQPVSWRLFPVACSERPVRSRTWQYLEWIMCSIAGLSVFGLAGWRGMIYGVGASHGSTRSIPPVVSISWHSIRKLLLGGHGYGGFWRPSFPIHKLASLQDCCIQAFTFLERRYLNARE